MAIGGARLDEWVGPSQAPPSSRLALVAMWHEQQSASVQPSSAAATEERLY